MSPSADVLQVYRRQHFMNRYGEGYEGSAGLETLCIYGNCLGWNREALYPAFADCAELFMENPYAESGTYVLR